MMKEVLRHKSIFDMVREAQATQSPFRPHQHQPSEKPGYVPPSHDTTTHRRREKRNTLAHAGTIVNFGRPRK